ncbi:MAG: TolC family protein [Gemmatimonadaceae bacterium]|nr:TolC family protein [Gemmatimonadaceae bacterium]
MKSFQLILAVAIAAAGLARNAAAQERRSISLEDALRMSQAQSEALRIAQAGVSRSRGQQMQARSQYLPQFSGSAGYTRTLATQFSAFQTSPGPQPPPSVPPVPPTDTSTYFQPCTRYLAPTGSNEGDRLQGLELYSRCASSGGGLDFSRVGFGARNQYQLAANGSLTLWSGGRVQAQNRVANAGRRSSEIELASQRAQLALHVTEAYYDAVLSDRLVAIAESSLVWTEGTLKQTTLARQVGNQSEFELLRSRVTRDNQVPVLLQRRTDRDLSYLRLKQLLNLPYAEPLQLTSDIDEPADARDVRTAATSIPTSVAAQMDTSVSSRAPVRQLDEALTAQEAQLAMAKSEWMPTVSVSTAYSRVAFGSGGIPNWGNWLNNWTVAVGASFPLFTGGRIRGQQMVVEADVEESRARLDQTRELAALDAQQSIAQLRQAESALAASVGTTEQAGRAFAIANVRYSEGISTQIELSESRLNLEQARTNRALAARNLQVARIRLALLKELPLGTAGAFGGGMSSMIGGAVPGSAAGAGATGGTVAPRTTSTTQQASTSQIPQ